MARYVRIEREHVALYAASLPLTNQPAPELPPPSPKPAAAEADIDAEAVAAFWLTLDAINFGSGWFPTLRKRPGRSGYYTISNGLRRSFDRRGPWSASELERVTPEELAVAFRQDPAHELMELFAVSLRELGARVNAEHGGSFESVVKAAGGSAVGLAELLSRWNCFADTSTYHGFAVPFLKRAQIAAADLARAGAADFNDLDQLTMFADNLVPHVLRLDGILEFEPELVERIDVGDLIEHGSPEEVEIRACALHAVELMVQASPQLTAAEIDQLLWHRGQLPRYKAWPRHRSRSTAY